MQGRPIHLRGQRMLAPRRRDSRWRLLLLGAGAALLIGVACWGPIAPSVLGPGVPAASLAAVSNGTELGAAGLPPQNAAGLTEAVITTPVPTRAPVLTPAPVASGPVTLPTVTSNGQALMAGIVSDRTALWVKNHTETALRSGPEDAASVFTQLPQWTVLKTIESRPNWLKVQYSGDGQTRQPGPGWVKASDVGAIDAPAVWLASSRTATVWSASEATASRTVDVPQSTIMEAVGPSLTSGTRVHVRLPGDGRSVPPSMGWVDADALLRSRAPSVFELPVAYPEALTADVRLSVPYRTQLDGSDFASANCGPTVLGMALESFGVNLPPAEVRGQVLTDESFEATDDDAGSYIWALADVAREHGLRVAGLYDGDGSTMHHWTTDEVRRAVLAGQPVILQVYYRALPGRADSGYYGDHYIIVTGLIGDSFLYNDPIGGAVARETPGFDRMISTSGLQRAMRASDTPYAFTAFSLARS